MVTTGGSTTSITRNPISPELSCINSGGIVIAASNWHPFSSMNFDFSERESTEKSIEIAYHAELKGIHPLVNVYITMEDHHLYIMGKSTNEITIFNSKL
jgi:hypothetical protein